MAVFDSGKFPLLHHLADVVLALLQTPLQIRFAPLFVNYVSSIN